MRLSLVSCLLGFSTGVLIAAAAVGVPPLNPAFAEVEHDMANGVNIPGGDIASFALPAPDPGLCRQACDQNNACRGWTFVKPGVQAAQAMCWLKGSIGQGTRDPNTISGLKPNSGGLQPGSARVENYMSLGYNLPGGDLNSFPMPQGDPAQCQSACDTRGDCRAWSFVKPGVQRREAVCWLKGSVPGAVADDNVISGLRRAVASAPPFVGSPGYHGGANPGHAGPGAWGVWASASGGHWEDPCAIQYVAAQILGNRYDGAYGYRRVRTRDSQQEADLDIDHFGRYHRDQPDGVVKMTSCEGTGTGNGDNGNAGNGGATGNFAGTYSNGQGGTITISGGGGSWTATEEWEGGGRNGTNRWRNCQVNGNTLKCDWTGEYRGDPDKTADRSGTLTATIDGDSLTGSYYENAPNFHWNVAPYDSAMHEGAVWPMNYHRVR